MLSIHEVRQFGKEYCQTQGAKHYRASLIDPIEFAIANNMAEDFFIINIIKYASRFKHTRCLEDLKKASDYAQILCGLELVREKEKVPCGNIEAPERCQIAAR